MKKHIGITLMTIAIMGFTIYAFYPFQDDVVFIMLIVGIVGCILELIERRE